MISRTDDVQEKILNSKKAVVVEQLTINALPQDLRIAF